jgi:shikimate kinase
LKGRALAFGAGTVVNAVATGFGAAFGIALWTKAEVDLLDEPGFFEGKILNEPSENTRLICTTVKHVLSYFKLSQVYGARVVTDSIIPISKGLKSSSVAANAVALATVAALKENLEDLEIIRIGVEAALESGVTITGAFDDACASYFGGYVVTDNLKRVLISRQQLKEDLAVMIQVPSRKSHREGKIKRMKSIKNYVEHVFNLALNGDYKTAITLNGLLYSAALGYDAEATVRALEAGAVSAGLTGTGPATIALCPRDVCDDIEASWKELEGRIIRTEFNNEKAKVF